MSKQVGNQNSQKNLATVYFWFIQHKSANFITLIFVFLSQKIFLIRLSGAPLACRALGQLFSFVPPFNYSTGLKRQSYAKIRDDRMRLNATQHFCAVGATWRIRPNGPIILVFSVVVVSFTL